MRRALFGGIGLALGVFANSASAQDARPQQAPVRAAKLGIPSAVPDSASTVDEGIRPAGLRSRLQGVPIVSTPAVGAPSTGPVVYGAPIPGTAFVPGGQPVPMSDGTVVPAPRPVTGGTPNVTEMRNSDGSMLYAPGTLGGIVVPSVAPGGTFAPGSCLEAPLYGTPMPGVGACERVGNCDRWWAAGEYLMWWTRSTTLPPLITTSSPQFSGIPGLGDTTTILGNGTFGDTFHSGGRVTLGRWLGDGQCRGIEGRLFAINESSSGFVASSTQFPVLARPFFNVNTPFGPFSEVVADPARGVGGVVVSMQHSLWGAEANFRRFLCGNPCARVDAIVGYRYIGMKDQLTITENFVSTGTNPPTVAGIPVAFGTVTDSFRTENHFNGGQIGLAGVVNRGRWSIDGRATVAFGNLTQIAEINGGQSLGLANGTTANFAGGLLALPGANIGRYTQNQFCVVPEVGMNIGYQLTSRLRLFVGYNFLYIGNALRPEGLIDTGIDVARIPNFPAGGVTPLPGVARPAPQFNLSDYFVQGISFGVQFRW